MIINNIHANLAKESKERTEIFNKALGNRFLLTGAGFHKEIGGLLCGELTEKFFNEIEDREIKNLLLGIDNFESALSIIRTKFKDKSEKINVILKNIFQEMHDGIIPKPLMQQFFRRFNATFTLNQDSIQKIKNYSGYDPLPGIITEMRELDNVPPLSLEYAKPIPYIELHGAFDWNDIFIIGDEKEEEIKKYQRIQEYFEFFKNCLAKQNCKLVIIGYSFCDKHINSLIDRVLRSNNNLGIFIWDPKVRECIFKGQKISGDILPTSRNQIEGIDLDRLKNAVRKFSEKKFNLNSDNDLKDLDNFLCSN